MICINFILYYFGFMVSNPLFLVFISYVFSYLLKINYLVYHYYSLRIWFWAFKVCFICFSHFAISEMYSEPSWMSGVRFLQKIVNCFKCWLFLQMTSVLMFHWVMNSPLSLLYVSNMVVLLFLFSIPFWYH